MCMWACGRCVRARAYAVNRPWPSSDSMSRLRSTLPHHPPPIPESDRRRPGVSPHPHPSTTIRSLRRPSRCFSFPPRYGEYYNIPLVPLSVTDRSTRIFKLLFLPLLPHLLLLLQLLIRGSASCPDRDARAASEQRRQWWNKEDINGEISSCVHAQRRYREEESCSVRVRGRGRGLAWRSVFERARGGRKGEWCAVEADGGGGGDDDDETQWLGVRTINYCIYMRFEYVIRWQVVKELREKGKIRSITRGEVGGGGKRKLRSGGKKCSRKNVVHDGTIE